MRILLLEHPRQISEAHFNDIAHTPLWSCLMSGYAGAALERAGFEVEMVDGAGLSAQECLGRLMKMPLPDLLAVHAVYNWEGTEGLFRFLSQLRGRGFEGRICLFGFFAGMVWKEILDFCEAVDHVVVGEPEQTLVELAKNLDRASGIKGLASRVKGEAVFFGARPRIESVEGAFPLRPFIESEDTVSVLASRGCYNNCSFCLIPTLDYGKSSWRGRSPENIVLEISGLLALGKRDFYFVDPNFIGPGKAGRDRAVELARRLAELGITFGMETRANDLSPGLVRELAGAGLNRLLLGVESCRPDVLKRIGKHTSAADNERAVSAVREAGIEPEIGFIMFDAESSLEDISINLGFLERNGLMDRLGRTANLLCHEFIALKGTAGYREALERKLLVPGGLFGFEGRLVYRDPRVGWLAGAAKRVCHFVLREMGKPFSAIHWSGDSANGEPYRLVNELLVDTFKGLCSLAERFGKEPDENGTEEMLCAKIGEIESAFRPPSGAQMKERPGGRAGPVRRSGPELPRLKGAFPFRLSTTSYILPEAILPNVRFLAEYFDEIELVFFESGREDNLPGVGEVREMARMASQLDISYNVHLPADLFLAEPDRGARRRFCDSALRFYERTLPLCPTCHILHLDSRRADGGVEADVSAWSERVCDSLGFLRAEGMDLGRVAVENLEYPPLRLLPFMNAFELRLCLDIGHMLRYGHDIGEAASQFFDQVVMAHLHGVENGKDHRAVSHIADGQWKTVCGFLQNYRGGLSLEVFSLGDLVASCERMALLAGKE